MAAEQKARLTYDNILRIIKDPEIADPIRFLRMREIVHFQRFGECLRRIQDQRNPKNFYAYNPQIDKIGIAILRWHEREAACRRIIMCLPVQLLF